MFKSKCRYVVAIYSVKVVREGMHVASKSGSPVWDIECAQLVHNSGNTCRPENGGNDPKKKFQTSIYNGSRKGIHVSLQTW